MNITLNLINTPYAANNAAARPTLQIKIFGTLDFSNPGNDKLYLDNNSTITVFAGGKIHTSSSSTEIIAIHNGTSDNIVWTGSPATINGLAYASSATVGFTSTFGVLPVKFTFFKAVAIRNAVKLSWGTAAEENSSYFIVEQYNTSRHSWEAIGKVAAAGNALENQTYSFYTYPSASANNQYRIKCVSAEDKVTYSSICKVTSAAAPVNVFYHQTGHSLQLQMPDDAQDRITVSLFDVNGKLIMKKDMKDANGSYIPLPFWISGTCIVHVVRNDKLLLSEKLWIGLHK